METFGKFNINILNFIELFFFNVYTNLNKKMWMELKIYNKFILKTNSVVSLILLYIYLVLLRHRLTYYPICQKSYIYIYMPF